MALTVGRYNPDGTIKKGCRKSWIQPKIFRWNQKKLKYLYRQKAAYTRQSHRGLVNELMKL
ncbi:MAG: hypothetical protein PHC91_05020 [Eubacteriales bacterium]|nr:hypothetical protein [Eubacteriales bacterium]